MMALMEVMAWIGRKEKVSCERAKCGRVTHVENRETGANTKLAVVGLDETGKSVESIECGWRRWTHLRVHQELLFHLRVFGVLACATQIKRGQKMFRSQEQPPDEPLLAAARGREPAKREIVLATSSIT